MEKEIEKYEKVIKILKTAIKEVMEEESQKYLDYYSSQLEEALEEVDFILNKK